MMAIRFGKLSAVAALVFLSHSLVAADAWTATDAEYTASDATVGAADTTKYNNDSKKEMFKRGEGLKKNKYPPAYNAPAGINVTGWDIFLTGSYIYWHVGQEGMELATSGGIAVSGGVTEEVLPADMSVLVQNFKYASGFRVGAGLNFDRDDWVAYVQYTRLHHTTKTSSVKAPEFPGAIPIWAVSWFIQGTPIGNETVPASKVTSKWHVSLDFLDASMSRPFYLGRDLTVTPMAGLRGAWIKQSLDVRATTGLSLNIDPQENPIDSHNHSSSWGIGPRAGVGANWLLGMGFRLEGEMAASLLYTRFSRVKHKENALSVLDTFQQFKSHYNRYNCLRPWAEGGLGLGWGMYTCEQGFHFDLCATYDFHYLWSQNMMRKLVDLSFSGSQASAGDLYFHGLTVTARFDF